MMKFTLSLVAILFLAEGCKTTQKSITNSGESEQKIMEQQTLSDTYIVSEIGNKKDFEQELTLTFDESSGRISGFSGCNTFFGNYSIKDSAIEFNGIMSSKKYCLGAVNKLERQFIDALGKVNSYTIKDNNIFLSIGEEQLLKAIKNVASRPNKNNATKDNYKQTLLTYQAQSRGMFEYIQVSESELKISSDRNLKNIKSYDWEPKDWEALRKMINAIDDDKFQNLKAPTDKRMYDGAPHATLSIIRGDVEIMTPSFDHGAPPKEIEDLVNKLLSIKESTTKQ